MPALAVRSGGVLKARARATRLTRQKQNSYDSGLCLATAEDGAPCACQATGRVPPGDASFPGETSSVPYCARHMAKGDDAVKAVKHPTKPNLGRILVAKRDLPKGYRFAYWGTRKRWDPRAPSAEFAMEFKPKCGVIDPTLHQGSVMQCAGHPGPDEARNLAWGKEHFGKRYDDVVGRELRLCQPVPAGHQVVLNYGADWMEARPGIPYGNIGTKKYPAPPAARLVRAALANANAGTAKANGKGAAAAAAASNAAGKEN